MEGLKYRRPAPRCCILSCRVQPGCFEGRVGGRAYLGSMLGAIERERRSNEAICRYTSTGAARVVVAAAMSGCRGWSGVCSVGVAIVKSESKWKWKWKWK